MVPVPDQGESLARDARAHPGRVEHRHARPTGTPPQRIPHPVPVKAAQGRTKTRLVLDPLPRPHGGADLHLARREKAGIHTITDRLNADHDTYPPPKGDTWTFHGVYAILDNPKYTGHMVWNRYTNPGKAAAAAAASTPRPVDLVARDRAIPRSSPATCSTPPRPSATAATPSPATRRAGPPAGPPHLRAAVPGPPPCLQAADVRRHPRLRRLLPVPPRHPQPPPRRRRPRPPPHRHRPRRPPARRPGPVL